MIKKSELFFHKIRNTVHTLLLFAVMAIVLAYIGFILADWEGMIWALTLSIILLLVAPKVSPTLVMRMYQAKLLNSSNAWEIHNIVAQLSNRAGLTAIPDIYYIPSSTINAFSVGSKKDPAIGVTDGLLKLLNVREMVAVLAHEISHINQNDMMVMGYADIINRVVSLMALLGLSVLVISLPFYLMGIIYISWSAIFILLLSPTLMSLLQLTLSRTREFNADMEAARLTGDPEGLALALQRIERTQGSFLEKIFLPSKTIPEPSVLRTHPEVNERIERLLSIRESSAPLLDYSLFQQYQSPNQFKILIKKPRWHIGGLWY